MFIGMHRRGIAVTVICRETSPNFKLLEDAGLPVLDIPLQKNFDSAGTKLLREELVRGNYQILHTFNSRALTNGLRAVRGLDIKVIAYRGIVGNMSFLDPMSWMRYLNPRIDRIVCVCDAIRRWFLEMQPAFLRMPASRPVTIHKGHDPDWYTDPPADLGAEGVPDGAFVIACTAAYRPRKGVDYLIAAMALIPDDIPAHLVLIGEMSARRLTQRIEQSPARDRIHRIGYKDDAPQYTAAADVFCLPSTKREGLPRAVIEAMMYRVPPVVTDSGGSPELIVDGESGILVPIKDPQALADAFTQLYRDEAARLAMGEAALERMKTHFRNEDTIEKTIALYEELSGANT
jgi:glycosyltransferase involved in cell wall biosynthesis